MKSISFVFMIALMALMTSCSRVESVSNSTTATNPGAGSGTGGGTGGSTGAGTGGSSTTASPDCDDPIRWGGNTQVAPSNGGAFSPTGAMSQPRAGHTATLLADGTVLVIAGGQLDIDDLLVSIPSAEVFDPTHGQFTTTGRPCIAREFHTSTLLKNGKVLVAGGTRFSGYPTWLPTTPTAELYDPASRSFTNTGSLQVGRAQHTATVLADGRILVTGGSTSVETLASTEIYDPVAGAFTVAASMAAPRTGHTATMLPSGKVLIVGGENAKGALASAELYDPVTNTFSVTGAMTAPRTAHTATLLENGKVLVAGGSSSPALATSGFTTASPAMLSTAELYDPVSGVFSPTGTMTASRIGHTATLLSDGKVLMTGGYIDWVFALPVEIGYETRNSAEIYDPSSGSFSSTDPMNATRLWHSATRLSDGSVLIAGGIGADLPLASAEIYKYLSH